MFNKLLISTIYFIAENYLQNIIKYTVIIILSRVRMYLQTYSEHNMTFEIVANSTLLSYTHLNVLTFIIVPKNAPDFLKLCLIINII